MSGALRGLGRVAARVAIITAAGSALTTMVIAAGIKLERRRQSQNAAGTKALRGSGAQRLIDANAPSA